MKLQIKPSCLQMCMCLQWLYMISNTTKSQLIMRKNFLYFKIKGAWYALDTILYLKFLIVFPLQNQIKGVIMLGNLDGEVLVLASQN